MTINITEIPQLRPNHASAPFLVPQRVYDGAAEVGSIFYDCLPEAWRQPLFTYASRAVWGALVVIPIIGIITPTKIGSIALGILALLSLQLVLISTLARDSRHAEALDADEAALEMEDIWGPGFGSIGADDSEVEDAEPGEQAGSSVEGLFNFLLGREEGSVEPGLPPDLHSEEILDVFPGQGEGEQTGSSVEGLFNFLLGREEGSVEPGLPPDLHSEEILGVFPGQGEGEQAGSSVEGLFNFLLGREEGSVEPGLPPDLHSEEILDVFAGQGEGEEEDLLGTETGEALFSLLREAFSRVFLNTQAGSTEDGREPVVQDADSEEFFPRSGSADDSVVDETPIAQSAEQNRVPRGRAPQGTSYLRAFLEANGLEDVGEIRKDHRHLFQ